MVDGTNMVSESLCEGILRTVVKFGKIAYDNGDDYTARANLMWASSLACNGICALGSDMAAWVCHAIEHELSAFYDITHGEGLAILTPQVMRYTLNDRTKARYAAFARRVFNISECDDKLAAETGINALEEFFASIGLPKTLPEVGITDDKHFKEMSEHACKCFPLHLAFEPLTPDDVDKILRMCM